MMKKNFVITSSLFLFCIFCSAIFDRSFGFFGVQVNHQKENKSKIINYLSNFQINDATYEKSFIKIKQRTVNINNEMELRINLEKKKYNLGELIYIDIKLINNSNQMIKINKNSLLNNIILQNEKKELIGQLKNPNCMHLNQPLMDYNLPPGGEIPDMICLNYLFDITVSQTYFIKIFRNIENYSNKINKKVISNSCLFVVKKSLSQNKIENTKEEFLLSIKPSKFYFLKDESIDVTISFQNLTKQNQCLVRQKGEISNYEFKIIDKNNNELNLIDHFRNSKNSNPNINTSGSFVPIAPYQQIVEQIDLRRLFKINSTGLYKIVAQRYIPNLNGKGLSLIKSKEVVIEIK